jgi:hypothetical protein
LRVPGGLAQPLGTPGTILQGIEMPGIIEAFPLEKGLTADSKVPAGKSCVIAVGPVEIKPIKP